MSAKARSSKTKVTSADRAIQTAIKKFPKLVKKKERSHKEKEKIAKAFRQVTTKLHREADQPAARPDCIKHFRALLTSPCRHLETLQKHTFTTFRR